MPESRQRAASPTLTRRWSPAPAIRSTRFAAASAPACGAASASRSAVRSRSLVAAVGARRARSGGGDDDGTRPADDHDHAAAEDVTSTLTLGDVVGRQRRAPATIVSPDAVAARARRAHHLREGRDRATAALGQAATADFGACSTPARSLGHHHRPRVMLDEGLPKVTGDLDVTAQPVTLVGLGDQAATSCWSPRRSVTVDGAIADVKAHRCTSSATRRLRARARPVRRVEGHRVQHGRGPRRRRPRPPRPRRRPPPRPEPRSEPRHHHRHAARALVLAPVLLWPARRRRRSPRPGWRSASPSPPRRAVWFQVTKLGERAQHRRARSSRSSRSSSAPARAPTTRPQSPDDPGLADAVHVIGVNPALKSATHHRHPARHRRPGRRRRSTRTS